jgi:hypothetical protein
MMIIVNVTRKGSIKRLVDSGDCSGYNSISTIVVRSDLSRCDRNNSIVTGLDKYIVVRSDYK